MTIAKRSTHGALYSYDQVEYKTQKSKVNILCLRCGLLFKQVAQGHIAGRGCPNCLYKGESNLGSTLLQMFNKVARQAPIVVNGVRYRFDYQIQDFDPMVYVEYQGEQHYKPVDFANKGDQWATKQFQKTQRNDKIKKDWCSRTGKPLIIVPYWIEDQREYITNELANHLTKERRRVAKMSDYTCETRAEERRECGYRHSGPDGVGLYLVSDGIGMHCDRLPFILLDSEGEPIKFFRGIKEIDPLELFHNNKEPIKDACDGMCAYCPMGGMRQNYGIIQFIGKETYSLDAFVDEAQRMGISRRIADVPNSFVFGQHWVYLAHLDGGSYLNPLSGQMERAPAIFKVFKPRLEIVIDDPNAIPDRAKELKDRYGANATIVKVVPI